MMVSRIKLIYIRIQICGLKYVCKMHSRYAKVRKFIFAVLTDFKTHMHSPFTSVNDLESILTHRRKNESSIRPVSI